MNQSPFNSVAFSAGGDANRVRAVFLQTLELVGSITTALMHYGTFSRSLVLGTSFSATRMVKGIFTSAVAMVSALGYTRLQQVNRAIGGSLAISYSLIGFVIKKADPLATLRLDGALVNRVARRILGSIPGVLFAEVVVTPSVFRLRKGIASQGLVLAGEVTGRDFPTRIAPDERTVILAQSIREIDLSASYLSSGV